MDKVITVDTATYHISDIYFIPTVAIFLNEEIAKQRLRYYNFVKPYILKNKERNFSILKDKTPILTKPI